MKTPPHRIAGVFLVLLVLAVVAALWWQTRRSVVVAPDEGLATSVRPRSAKDSAAGPEAPAAQDMPMAGIAAADAAALGRCTEDLNALVKARTRDLGEANGARAQLAYAFVAPFTVEAAESQGVKPDMGFQWMEALQAKRSHRALEAWRQSTDDPDVRWLAAVACTGEGDCSRVRQAVAQAEPENANAWLLVMESARQRNDPVAMESALQLAAKAGRYDRHAGSAATLILDAYAHLQMPASCSDRRLRVVSEQMREVGVPGIPLNPTDRVMSLASMVEGLALPSFAALQEVCDPAIPAMQETRRAACLRVYTTIADNGDSLLEQAVATRRLVELHGDAVGADILRERLRENAWLMAQQGDASLLGQVRPEDSALGEVRALQAALESSGRWPPPADWLPRDEHARSLVLTGRPPPPAPPK